MSIKKKAAPQQGACLSCLPPLFCMRERSMRPRDVAPQTSLQSGYPAHCVVGCVECPRPAPQHICPMFRTANDGALVDKGVEDAAEEVGHRARVKGTHPILGKRDKSRS